MTRGEFENLCTNNIVYLDGATGSNLVKAGMPSGVCPEKWILEHKNIFISLQKKYIDAGSDILYAPTFTANRVKLKEYGLENELDNMIAELVALTKEATSCASNKKVYVAGDITMTGKQLEPLGTMPLEELIDIYKEQIVAMEKAGVDLLVVETIMSLAEARAALIAAKEVSSLPVMVTMTFEQDGRTLFGTDATTAAVVLESLGAAAIGANCSTGPAKMKELIQTMATVTEIPIIAKPNAGLPMLGENGDTIYSMSATEFAHEMKILLHAGATILGGCCGTDPSYIKKMKKLFSEEENYYQRRMQLSKVSDTYYLTSERKTVSFGSNNNFLIVGERINPTGKKILQAELREGIFDSVIRLAEEQEQNGAQILDINVGMGGIDEKEMMIRAMEEVGNVTNLPLSLDSSNIDVLEEALRRYPGRALINSISLEKEKYEKLIPIAAKYGAVFILLPLSDEGLPQNITEKKEIIHKIYERASQCGMKKTNIIVDGLVTTVGANKMAALETLETIRYCKELGFATVCGLSNISFGMPERAYVNAAFLTLAIREGLTMAIANPSQELLVSCALATDMLLIKEDSDIRYIEYMNQMKEKKEKVTIAQSKPEQVIPNDSPKMKEKMSENPQNQQKLMNTETIFKSQIAEAVLKGNRKGIAKITQDAVASGEDPSTLLNQVLLPAINKVGEYFDQGRYFLPQLIAGAEAMKSAIDILEPLLLKTTDGENMPVVVIATVEGDIHDIGKNLVSLMLKNYGFQVIDLGKDVPQKEIIKVAKEHHAQIIALSALMTTTMQRMKEIITAVKKENLTVKVMVGGAVITEEYAQEIGADGYSRDAAGAVKLACKLKE